MHCSNANCPLSHTIIHGRSPIHFYFVVNCEFIKVFVDVMKGSTSEGYYYWRTGANSMPTGDDSNHRERSTVIELYEFRNIAVWCFSNFCERYTSKRIDVAGYYTVKKIGKNGLVLLHFTDISCVSLFRTSPFTNPTSSPLHYYNEV